MLAEHQQAQYHRPHQLQELRRLDAEAARATLGKIPEAETAQSKARMISWKEELKTNPKAPPPSAPPGMNVVQ